MRFGTVDLQIPRGYSPATPLTLSPEIGLRNMPEIDDSVLDCVFYLYPTASDANEGVCAGGTGFLVSIGFTDHDSLEHVYAVSNHHVVGADRGQSPVIRLNTHDGKHDVLP